MSKDEKEVKKEEEKKPIGPPKSTAREYFESFVVTLIMAIFGVLGYICVKLECEPAPMILGFILGPLMEENLRRAMLLSRGDPFVFFQKPISLGFMVASAILLVIVALPTIRKKREEAFVEESK